MVFICALTGGINFLSSGSCYEKHLRYLSMLLTLLALLAPLPNLLSSFEQAKPPEELVVEPELVSRYGTLLKEQTEKRLNEEITGRIKDQCGLNNTEFSVSCHLILDEKTSSFSIGEISLTLRTAKAVAHRESIRALIAPISKNCIFKEDL